MMDGGYFVIFSNSLERKQFESLRLELLNKKTKQNVEIKNAKFMNYYFQRKQRLIKESIIDQINLVSNIDQCVK